uniref:ATP synthase F0 subunit 8 n=1 Tax=Pseudoniphargus sorbasiensis TaxID=1688788 RepID=A0A0M6X5D2_9CRUS|nr:ATP synthase F0 subunit 8 [Pseudoniphargus sorbasiensis]
MPQMAPIMWLNFLVLLVLLVYILMSFLFFLRVSSASNTTMMHNTHPKLHWSW